MSPSADLAVFMPWMRVGGGINFRAPKHSGIVPPSSRFGVDKLYQGKNLAGLWESCLETLEVELTAQQFNTWIRPLQAVVADGTVTILAPNRFVRDWVDEKYRLRIEEILERANRKGHCELCFEVGSQAVADANRRPATQPGAQPRSNAASKKSTTNLNRNFTFESFIEGKSNQLGRAAAIQVSENEDTVYNPLLIYGGVGLGKTHLIHAAGHKFLKNWPDKQVVYLHAERFVSDMVTALQRNTIDRFKQFYRSIDVLLVDDIQFFAGKERSQEEFFHVFNALLEGQHQVIMTCDRYPKDIKGLEDRLKSRFGWGLTVSIEPPELETRVAIVKTKAEAAGVKLPDEVAFFIAKRIYSNIRELEGALRRVLAYSNFTHVPITTELAQQALKDIVAVQDRQVSLDMIQKTVAEYYRIRTADLLSKSRKRSVTRPRQLAMALAKQLTSKSLPEIGAAFGGRDHTTVLHACDRMTDLRQSDPQIEEDYKNLMRKLTV